MDINEVKVGDRVIVARYQAQGMLWSHADFDDLRGQEFTVDHVDTADDTVRLSEEQFWVPVGAVALVRTAPTFQEGDSVVVIRMVENPIWSSHEFNRLHGVISQVVAVDASDDTVLVSYGGSTTWVPAASLRHASETPNNAQEQATDPVGAPPASAVQEPPPLRPGLVRPGPPALRPGLAPATAPELTVVRAPTPDRAITIRDFGVGDKVRVVRKVLGRHQRGDDDEAVLVDASCDTWWTDRMDDHLGYQGVVSAVREDGGYVTVSHIRGAWAYSPMALAILEKAQEGPQEAPEATFDGSVGAGTDPDEETQEEGFFEVEESAEPNDTRPVVYDTTEEFMAGDTVVIERIVQGRNDAGQPGTTKDHAFVNTWTSTMTELIGRTGKVEHVDYPGVGVRVSVTGRGAGYDYSLCYSPMSLRLVHRDGVKVVKGSGRREEQSPLPVQEIAMIYGGKCEEENLFLLAAIPVNTLPCSPYACSAYAASSHISLPGFKEGDLINKLAKLCGVSLLLDEEESSETEHSGQDTLYQSDNPLMYVRSIKGLISASVRYRYVEERIDSGESDDPDDMEYEEVAKPVLWVATVIVKVGSTEPVDLSSLVDNFYM